MTDALKSCDDVLASTKESHLQFRDRLLRRAKMIRIGTVLAMCGAAGIGIVVAQSAHISLVLGAPVVASSALALVGYGLGIDVTNRLDLEEKQLAMLDSMTIEDVADLANSIGGPEAQLASIEKWADRINRAATTDSPCR